MARPPAASRRLVVAFDEPERAPGARRRPPAWAWAVAALAVAATVAQLALPTVAEWVIERRLGGDTAVDVRAVPALTLLVGRADRVTVVADRLGAGGSGTSSDGLGALRRAREVDLRVGVVDAGAVRLEDVTLHKRNDTVTLGADALLSESAEVRFGGVSATLAVYGQEPTGLALRGRAGPLDAGAALQLDAGGDGDVVLRPAGGIGSVLSVSVFANDAVEILGVLGEPAGGGRLRVRVTARVR